MHSDEQRTTALVEAARAGDPRAREELVRVHLPLVHSVVGRALDHHADTDDVVQETLVRALDGLTGLRDPARFRSWLVAIAMNGVRRRWRERQQAPVTGLDRAAELADPAGDFTELAILRLGLTGQRRDVARATRWLDGDDRELLSLWWLEAAGELTRAELAEALALTPQHAAVRVQRMRERLETGRSVVRALDAEPPCPALAETLTAWDGRPSPLWRKRIARHLRGCGTCAADEARRGGLAPVEGLLVGIGLVPPTAGALWDGLTPPPAAPDPAAYAQGATAGDPTATDPTAGDPTVLGVTATDPTALGTTPLGTTAPATTGPAHAAVPPTGPFWTPGLRAVAAGAAAVAVLGMLALSLPARPEARYEAGRPPAPARATPAPPSPRPVTATPTSAPTPARPSPTPTATAVPTPRRTPTVPPPSPGEQVTALVNRLRAEAGCRPLRTDPRLVAAARAHARDMAARGYYGHSSPEGVLADTRITEAGYSWSGWAENLARGQEEPAEVVESWRDGAGHERNMLDCGYRHTGVALAPGPGGPVWVQELAAPGP